MVCESLGVHCGPATRRHVLKEHGCRWTESLMAGVVSGELKWLFAAVQAT